MVNLLTIAYIIARCKNLKSNYILWYNISVNISQKAGGRQDYFKYSHTWKVTYARN